MGLKYRGWVPNLNGSISFSTFGKSASLSRIETANVGDGQDRYIVSSQERKLTDALIYAPSILDNYFNIEGRFHLVCVARTDGVRGSSDESLKGILCLVHGDTWHKNVKKGVRDAQHNLGICQREFPQLTPAPYIDAQFSSSYIALIDLLRRKAEFTCNFQLAKTGIVTLEAPTSWRWNQNCTTEEEKVRQRFLVSSQLFYFLKDLGHRHQHHSDRTDTICDLYPAGDDLGWKFEVIRRLYLKMTEYEWVHTDQVYFSSLGILSYLRSFHRITKPDLMARYSIVERAIFPLDDMELSINASQETMSRNEAASSATRDQFRNLMIGVLGLILSYISLSQMITNGVIVPADVAPSILYIDRFILQQPVMFSAIVAGFISGCSIVVYRRQIKQWRFAYWVVRALSLFKAEVAVIVLLLLGIANLALWLNLGFWICALLPFCYH